MLKEEYNNFYTLFNQSNKYKNHIWIRLGSLIPKISPLNDKMWMCDSIKNRDRSIRHLSRIVTRLNDKKNAKISDNM